MRQSRKLRCQKRRRKLKRKTRTTTVTIRMRRMLPRRRKKRRSQRKTRSYKLPEWFPHDPIGHCAKHSLRFQSCRILSLGTSKEKRAVVRRRGGNARAVANFHSSVEKYGPHACIANAKLERSRCVFPLGGGSQPEPKVF